MTDAVFVAVTKHLDEGRHRRRERREAERLGGVLALAPAARAAEPIGVRLDETERAEQLRPRYLRLRIRRPEEREDHALDRARVEAIGEGARERGRVAFTRRVHHLARLGDLTEGPPGPDSLQRLSR